MRILISNDDGIRAPGLKTLVDVARQFGDVVVAAPDRERSACGHAMTMREPLRVQRVEWEGVRAFEVNGLPVDCINVGLTVGWPDGCDLVLSGINNGPNLGFDITYSGTVGAAIEGCINGIPSIGFSVALFVAEAPAHFETASQWLTENWEMLIGLPQKPLTFLNVNIPSIAYPELNGHRMAVMGQRIYKDRVEERSDPWGRPYYWQGGVAVMDTHQPGTDVDAVLKGYVSITPVSLDWTDHHHLATLEAHLNNDSVIHAEAPSAV